MGTFTEQIPSQSDYFYSHRLAYHVVMMLDMYPILSRQIKSNYRVTLEPQDDVDPKTARETKSTRSMLSRDAGQEHQELLIRELARVEKSHRFHFIFVMSVYIIELVRYFLVHLISLEALSNYHYLDCYILGRFRFIGRTNMIGSSIICAIVTAAMAFRYFILIMKPKLSFHSVEFLMYKYEHVVGAEKEFEFKQEVEINCGPPAKRRKWPTRPVKRLERHTKPNPIFCLENKFHGHSTRLKWILRPNRTSHSWIIMSAIAHYGFYTTVAMTIIGMCLMVQAIGGSIVTNLGFEMSYPTCVAYIQREQRHAGIMTEASNGTTTAATLEPADRIPYSHIYLAPARLAHQKRIEEIPAIIPMGQFDLKSMTTYSMVRIIIDVIANLFWYLEFFGVVISFISVLLNVAGDVVLNAHGIMEQLEQHIGRLAELQASPDLTDDWSNVRQPSSLKSWANTASTSDYRCQRRLSLSRRQSANKRHATLATLSGQTERCTSELETDSTLLQATLVDHFLLVRDYSKLVSSFLNFMLMAYVQYTIVIAYWTGSVQSRTVEFEFLVGEAIGTGVAILFFSSAALAHSLNFRLYRLIAEAMAHDSNPSSKRRWAKIMDYYKPQPLYCFVLLGSIEISWLFCLKFISWMVSVFVVLASFSYMNRH